MKVSALFLILYLSFSLVYSQKSAEFGEVSIKEFSKEAYSSDTASAVILFDVGSLMLEPRSTVGSVLKRHIRIKILTQQAVNYWGSYSFLVSSEGTMKIKGATYNLEDGAIRVSELEDASVMRTNHNREFKRVSVAFPNVKEGSIVELSYVVKHPGFFIPEWQFQYTFPSRRSEYTVYVPVKHLKYNLRGFLTPSAHEEKYEGSHHYWLMKDIPAFVPEPMMADQDAYVSEVGFSPSTGEWEDSFYRLVASPRFGEIIHRHKFLNSIVEELTAGMTEERQKIKAISDYIKQQVQFDGTDDYMGTDPNELFEKKKGSVGDINLLFGSMLEKAGLKVNMILLSTRTNGTIDQKIPSLRQFNYVICEVATKDGDLLVDATDKLLPFDMLPPRCYNQIGFLVGTAQYGWIPIQPKHRKKLLLDATVSFTDAGGLTGKLKSFREGYAAYDIRNSFRAGNRENYKIDLGNKLWNVGNHEIRNVETVNKPIEETCDISIDDYVMMANDKIYFNPHLFLREEANPFVSDSRLYPVDFDNLVDNTVVCTLIIPDGYVVEELPENKAIVLSGNAAKCTFSTTVDGNKIMVMSKLIFNKSFFLPSDYVGLKEFYGKLVAKKAENIVLKKK